MHALGLGVQPAVFDPAFALQLGGIDEFLDQQGAVGVGDGEDRFAFVGRIGRIDLPDALVVDDADMQVARPEFALGMEAGAGGGEAVLDDDLGGLEGQRLDLLAAGRLGGQGRGGDEAKGDDEGSQAEQGGGAPKAATSRSFQRSSRLASRLLVIGLPSRSSMPA